MAKSKSKTERANGGFVVVLDFRAIVVRAFPLPRTVDVDDLVEDIIDKNIGHNEVEWMVVEDLCIEVKP